MVYIRLQSGFATRDSVEPAFSRRLWVAGSVPSTELEEPEGAP